MENDFMKAEQDYRNLFRDSLSICLNITIAHGYLKKMA